MGEKLNKDVTPDKKKLEILTSRQDYLPNKEKDRITKVESSNIDMQNSIQSISALDGNIVVKFNKDYSRSDINQISRKIANTYEYSFDILGKYKYAKSTKIKIHSVNNIDIQDNSNSVNIKISNSENIKMTYSLAPRELIIKIPNNQQNTPTNISSINKKDSISSNSLTNELPSSLPSSISSSITNGKPKHKIIVLDIYGNFLTKSPNPVNLLLIYLILIAEIIPVVTNVIANPILNPNTRVAPNVTFFSCKHKSNTVIVAGQGINPPVNPNSNICGLVTFLFSNFLLISLA